MHTTEGGGFHQIVLFWKLDGVFFLEKQVFHVVIQTLPVYILKISLN